MTSKPLLLIPDPIASKMLDPALPENWIWDQLLLTVRINTRTWVAPSEVASSKTGNKAGPDPT